MEKTSDKRGRGKGERATRECDRRARGSSDREEGEERGEGAERGKRERREERREERRNKGGVEKEKEARGERERERKKKEREREKRKLREESDLKNAGGAGNLQSRPGAPSGAAYFASCRRRRRSRRGGRAIFQGACFLAHFFDQ